MTGAPVSPFSCNFALIRTRFWAPRQGVPPATANAQSGGLATDTDRAPRDPPEPTLEAPTRRILGRPAPGTPPPGELVLERYRLHERLGAGGFGVVWRASDELLQREVALKRIPLGGRGRRRAGDARGARLRPPVAPRDRGPVRGMRPRRGDVPDLRARRGLHAREPDRRREPPRQPGARDRHRPLRRPRPRPRPRRHPPRHQAPERARPGPLRAARRRRRS